MTWFDTSYLKYLVVLVLQKAIKHIKLLPIITRLEHLNKTENANQLIKHFRSQQYLKHRFSQNFTILNIAGFKKKKLIFREFSNFKYCWFTNSKNIFIGN
jgi:hypothetical protein